MIYIYTLSKQYEPLLDSGIARVKKPTFRHVSIISHAFFVMIPSKPEALNLKRSSF